MYLNAFTNNQASTVFQLFQNAVTLYSLPSRVRSDQGLENLDVARYMLHEQSLNRGAYYREVRSQPTAVERSQSGGGWQVQEHFHVS